MYTTKQINIKNRTYYFYNDIIDIENFYAKLLIFLILDMSQRKTLVVI